MTASYRLLAVDALDALLFEPCGLALDRCGQIPQLLIVQLTALAALDEMLQLFALEASADVSGLCRLLLRSIRRRISALASCHRLRGH